MAENVADELIDLERRAWQALATDGAAGPFYDEVLDEHPLILLPGGLVMDDRAAIVESMSGAPWGSYELEDFRVVSMSSDHDVEGDAAVVTYRARARRGDHDYEALMSSAYVRRHGTWRLVLHQQTPR